MPLDEFKTQVLLLHAEESTLEQLSSGFGDRYTVHCATSGSEALNTLVETPINVMVTAQNLPGMSGLDALREAKKRSPSTIGILIAGGADAGLEAMVGDEEVFQVVRGNVTAEGLLKLVENATQQMRLMTLAKSANDTMANVDRPVTEHIIMETSENGSPIISDGTGRMPALDPEKVSASASVGSRAVDVLVLTKDQEFLETIKDSSRGMHKVFFASTLSQADTAIRKHKIGVAVVDAAMVGEKLEQLTQHLRKGVPRLVSIVAGRRDDGDMLMDLINRGKVYRFLLKPVSPGRARLAVESSVKHHLEAPNSAFVSKSRPAAAKKLAAAKKAKAVRKAAPKAAPKATPKATPKAARPRRAPLVNAPPDPPLGSSTMVGLDSPTNKGLAGAFGEDQSSLVDTVSGLVGSISAKLSGLKSSRSAAGGLAKTQVAVTAAPSSGSLLRKAKLLGIGAVAIAIIAGSLYWFVGGSDEMPAATDPQMRTPSFTETEFVSEAAPAPVQPVIDINALLKEARFARAAGHIFNPIGSNAIELFVAASEVAPNDAIVAAELETVVAQALGMAESAMLGSRLDDAAAALQRIAIADADNARLPFLSAQLSQMQLRSYLDLARTAIRENRFEDAAAALFAAHGLITTDDTEINAVANELSAARSAQQADDVLEKANARLKSGDLLTPANDNARYYFELVLSVDSRNTSARQGLNAIASKLVLQARAELDKGNVNAAEDILGDARALDPGNSELDATATAVINARAALAAQQRQAEAARVEAARVEAARVEAARVEAERLEAERLEAERQAAIEPAAEGPAEMGPPEEGSAEMGPPEEGPAAMGPTVEDRAISVRNSKPAGVSSLNRVKYVAPKYPRAALRRNLSGWVDVAFTVAFDGSVKDIDVPKSHPNEIFVESAIQAVEKWEFEPVLDNGTIIEKRVAVRMLFALE